MKSRWYNPSSTYTAVANKFYRKNGSLTLYAFSCGYIERLENKNHDRIDLSKDGNWHVKSTINGKFVWEVFDSLTEARKYVKQLKANN